MFCLTSLHEVISSAIGRIAMKLCTDIHAAQTQNLTDFDGLLTFPLAPPAG